MSAKRKKKLCAYCGGDNSLEKLTREHFVPQCLWAGKRPNGTKTVPVHESCNAAFADDNDYFRAVIVADDGVEEHPEAYDVLTGPVKRIIESREGQWRRYTKGYRLRPRYSPFGVYMGHQYGFPIDMKRMERVLGNVVKGIYYTLIGKPLPQTTKIVTEIFEGERDLTKSMNEMLGEWTGFGDDVFTCRFAFCDDLDDMVCLLSFYRRKFYFCHTVSAPRPEQPINFESAVILS